MKAVEAASQPLPRVELRHRLQFDRCQVDHHRAELGPQKQKTSSGMLRSSAPHFNTSQDNREPRDPEDH